jgi:hypothetical protein
MEEAHKSSGNAQDAVRSKGNGEARERGSK